jgi:site-specific DNA-adenine methylase
MPKSDEIVAKEAQRQQSRRATLDILKSKQRAEKELTFKILTDTGEQTVSFLLRAISNAEYDKLLTVNLLTRPWQATLDAAQPGDLVYCDPPYLSNFVGYHGDGFSDGETCSLFAECKRLSSRGCDVWMSNAGTDRIRELAAIYGSATLISVDARRSIAANGGKRGVAKELLIKF